MFARFVALLAWLGVCATALAAPDSPKVGLHLHVEASAGCPDQAAFLAELRGRGVVIREAPEGESAATMQVELSTARDGAIGRLTFRPREGPLEGEALHREVSGTDCGSVAEGLALIAAVILNPAGPTVDLQPAPSAVPQPPPSAVPRPPPSAVPQPEAVGTRPASATAPGAAPLPAAPPSAPAAQPNERLHLALGAELTLASGVGPDPAVIPGGFVDVDLPAPLARWSTRLSAGRALSRPVQKPPYGTVEFNLTDFRLEPCFRALGSAALRLRACALLEGGILEGDGSDPLGAEKPRRPVLEAGLGVRPTWTVSDRVVLGLSASATVSIVHYGFYFAQDSPGSTAYTLDRFSASGEFSVGVRIW